MSAVAAEMECDEIGGGEAPGDAGTAPERDEVPRTTPSQAEGEDTEQGET
ncbi:hypothetical protein GCM10009601_25010 [Streptomyces thermospinosisporus]|uniref:Uncharacterized protein n=1 Tax=Streptomyces thermospinosisporus TaxID=161482 RepID=A0ABN1YW00_9ACTN